MRRAAALLIALGFAAVLSGDVITLPAASSLVGLNPFFSDVRVFNTSYTTSLDVTATYRCFIGSCRVGPSRSRSRWRRARRARSTTWSRRPTRSTRTTPAEASIQVLRLPGPLVVTSRLFSTEPLNSVGMFIPALSASRAYASSILSSIRDDAGDGVGHFRTNVGFFNPGDGPANVTVTIFDGGTNQVGNALTRTIDGHSGVQIDQVFQAAGQGSFVTSNAAIVVSADSPIFSYASVLDNNRRTRSSWSAPTTCRSSRYADRAHGDADPAHPHEPPTSTPAGPTFTPSVTNTRTQADTPSPTPSSQSGQHRAGDGLLAEHHHDHGGAVRRLGVDDRQPFHDLGHGDLGLLRARTGIHLLPHV